MKIAFFLVVLANVILLLWEYNRSDHQRVDKKYETVASSEREAILLESELNKDQQNEISNHAGNPDRPPANTAPVIENTAVHNTNQEEPLNRNKSEINGMSQAGEHESTRCYRAGPFFSADSIDLWSKRLSSSGARIKFISRKEKIISDYVVYYPAAEAMEETEANLEMLKRHGLTEFWIKRTGDEKGQILLGIFSREEKALKMKNELQIKGINAELKPRHQYKTSRYALILFEDRALDSVDGLKKSYPDISLDPLAKSSEHCLIDSGENFQSSDNKAAKGLKIESGQSTPPADDEAGLLFESNGQHSAQNSGDIPVTGQNTTNHNALQTCYRVGPFADERLFQRWKKQLAAAGLEIKPLTRDEKAIADYLVYYPAAKTQDQSAADIQMLKSHGLTDIWMIRTGDEKGKISLGVFSKENRAVLMKNQLRAKGINAEIKPRYKTALAKYLVVKGGSKVKDSLKTLENDYPGLIAKPFKNCLEFKPDN